MNRMSSESHQTRLNGRVAIEMDKVNSKMDPPDDMSYYGEHSFQMRYKDTIGKPFNWLYIDADTLREKAWRSGYAVEVIAEGEHYDYLARITKRE